MLASSRVIGKRVTPLTATNSSTTAVPQYWYCSMYEYICRLTERRGQHSTIPLHTAENQYVPIRVSTKRSMYVHAFCVPFVFVEHEALGICKSPQMLDHLLYNICRSFRSMLFREPSYPAEPMYRYTATALQQWYVRVCTLSLNREHSIAHSAVAQPPVHKAANNQVRADQSTYQKISHLRQISST